MLCKDVKIEVYSKNMVYLTLDLLRDIDLAKTVATTAEALEKKTQVQALLDATVTVVSAMA